jgi:segregation and condensation protein A
MQMDEKTIPWWRKVLQIALGGLRSGFGLFPRPARLEPVPEPMILNSIQESPEEDRTLTEPSLQVVAAPMNPAEPAPAAVLAKAAEQGRKENNRAEKQTTKIQEATEIEVVHEAIPEPMKAAEPERQAEPETAAAPEAVVEVLPKPIEEATSEPVSETVIVPEPAETPEKEAVNEVIEEPVEELEPVIAAEPEPAPAVEQTAPVIEPEPAAEPEPVSEPTTIPVAIATAAPRRLLKPQPSEEEKAAARKAARQKKLDEGSEESPFSVIVGQVYDGPMDLLLDLIRKQDIDIYDIPIATITSQFLAYVNQLRASDVDVAGDFIYTASLLIHIKSKMLLPHTDIGPEQAAEDPRRELVERLLEHERFKNAAQMLLEKQMLEAASWSNPGAREFKDDEAAEPEIAADTVDLVRIFREILERARNRPVIDVEEDSVTVGQMIQFLARRLTLEDKPVALRRLLSHTHSERALIAMFLALLEMVRLQAILLRQDRQFSEIFIKKHSGFETVMNEGLGAARDDWR